jgi:hypothetical protein
MATTPQITANQQNAQSSTGPQTEQGKAAVSQNALKHGLTAPFDVLDHEDQDEFDALLQGTVTSSSPPVNIKITWLTKWPNPAGASPAPSASRSA